MALTTGVESSRRSLVAPAFVSDAPTSRYARSRSLSMPTRAPRSTTGTCRMSRSRMRSRASAIVASVVTVTGCVVISVLALMEPSESGYASPEIRVRIDAPHGRKRQRKGPEHVTLGDDADEPAIFHYREAPDALLEHDGGGLGQRRVGIGRQPAPAHHVLDPQALQRSGNAAQPPAGRCRQALGERGREDRVANITVGNHAHQLARIVDDRQMAYTTLTHDGGRRRDRRLGIDRVGCSRHHVLHPRRHGRSFQRMLARDADRGRELSSVARLTTMATRS